MQLLEVVNEFVVNDINKTIDFYSKYFNFEIVETDGKPITWIKMKKIMLQLCLKLMKQFVKK